MADYFAIRGTGARGVLSASVGVGFQWADSPTNGASTIVVTDGDPAAAQRHALALADYGKLKTKTVIFY